jgi:F-type H+-transporting ATPase subunit epsilon
MKVEIITPETVVFSGDNVSLVQVPGICGSFELMENHAPLISVLKKGRVKVLVKGEKPAYYDIKGGVIEILDNKVLVLAE